MDQAAPGLERFVGETIAGRYEVEKLLGEGGMGAVFKARHAGLKRDVAVKLMHAEVSRDPQVSARFDREAQSASRLDHPNCVRVTDFGTWNPPDGSLPAKFMVMQYLEGHELSRDLGHPLSAERALDLMGQILEGLTHAHEHGIIHRDIKPENVFVTTDHTGAETLKIVDFGLAKIVSGEGSKDQMTKAGLVFGTPRYMSPEQAAGGQIDERTDLYACGIILYEMLAGHPPFDAEDLVGLLRAQITQEPPPLPSGVPAPLSAIVMRLLQKSAKDRYESARQVREVLRNVATRLAAGDVDAPAVDAPVSAAVAATVAALGGPDHGAPAFPAPGTVAAIPAPSFPQLPAVQTRPALGGGVSNKTWIAIGAGVAVATVVLLLASSGGDDAASEEGTKELAVGVAAAEGEAKEPSDEETADSVNLAAAVAGAVPSLRAPASDVREVDAAIEAKQFTTADSKLQPLLDEFPQDPQLLWRRGKLEAHKPKGKAIALATYAEALTEDPNLLDDETFAKELDELLYLPALRDPAVDVAVQRMGAHGHEFLLEIAALDEGALGYVDRHRVLDAVAGHPKRVEFVDDKLQTALDAWQAPQALDPCAAFAASLNAMEAKPDAYYLGTLETVGVPAPRAANKDEKTPPCPGAAQRLDEVRAAHVAKFADAERVYPADYEPKRGRKKSRGQSSGDDGSGGRRWRPGAGMRRIFGGG